MKLHAYVLKGCVCASPYNKNEKLATKSRWKKIKTIVSHL